MSYRVITKRCLNSKTVTLEYFNNWILVFRNKVTREMKQIAVEYKLLFIEYKIETENRRKVHPLQNRKKKKKKKLISRKQMKIAFYLLMCKKVSQIANPPKTV